MNLRQLAEMLNLSQTTVSRALNGYPEVNEATRVRVLEAAQRNNYRPNARARSLATGRSMAIGHVISMSSQDQLFNVVFSDFAAGASEIYAEHGYDMLMSAVPADAELQAYHDIVGRGAVDGFIVHGPLMDDARLPLLESLGMPFVVHGRSTNYSAPYSYVDVNNRRAIERATRYLLELGHTRIALVNGPETMDFAIRRRAGYLAALAQFGIEPDPDLMAADGMTEPYGREVAKRMMSLPNPPTAFVCSALLPSLGIRRVVEGQGMQLGSDISLVCFDDDITALPNGEQDEPAFTATRSSVRAAGRRCAEILIQRIQDPTQPHVQELWDADLILGRSTGVPKPQKETA